MQYLLVLFFNIAYLSSYLLIYDETGATQARRSEGAEGSHSDQFRTGRERSSHVNASVEQVEQEGFSVP